VLIGHRLVTEIVGRDGRVLAETALNPDWEPAIEWTSLTGLRRHGVWAPDSSAKRTLEPLWHDTMREPYIQGFRVHQSCHGVVWHEDFSTRYLHHLASTAAVVIEKGALVDEDDIVYRTRAHAAPQLGVRQDGGLFTTIEQPSPLDVRDLPRAMLEESTLAGDTHRDDFQVCIPREVLDEASSLTSGAGDIETGGILIGHIGRIEHTDICLMVTALVPARHTTGDSVKLTFTSDTWTDVRRALALRAKGEIAIGWFHSHPQFAWCRERGCSPEQQQRCRAADGFLSVDDLALHRTMFPRAFTMALVMTHSIKGIVPRLFGWRSGLLEPRGYRVCDRPFVPQGESDVVPDAFH
jgi:proteasome lid subunit RPN8/RPN11